MNATPALFGPTQNPLAASRLHQDPVSSTGLGSIFHSSRRFPSVAFTSRPPVVAPGHSLAFDSLRRVKPTTSSGVDATPALFRPTQSPLAAVLLRQAPLSVITARCRGDFRRVGLGGAFRCFRSFPSRRFTSRFPTLTEAVTTLLSIAQRRCRPAACSVCTLPLSLRAGEYPLAANQPAPGSYSAAPVRLLERALRLSPADFPRGVSRFPSSGFQPHGSQGHVGLGDHFRRRHLPRAQVCTLPLLIRPAEQPDRLPSSVRHPNDSVMSGQPRPTLPKHRQSVF